MQNASQTSSSGIDDFSDNVITRKYWNGYFSLDCGLVESPKKEDSCFLSRTREEAAQKIRCNACGDSKPVSVKPCLSPYQIRYTLVPHWERKERFIKMGVDPEEVMDLAMSKGWKNWKSWKTFPTWVDEKRIGAHLEFFLCLLMMEGDERIARKKICADDFIDEVLEAVSSECTILTGSGLTESCREKLRERLEAVIFIMRVDALSKEVRREKTYASDKKRMDA